MRLYPMLVAGCLLCACKIVLPSLPAPFPTPSPSVVAAECRQPKARASPAAGTLVTIAGTGTPGFGCDGFAATSARLAFPHSLAFDRAGNLYVSEHGNHRIRKIDQTGTITTVAGSGPDFVAKDSFSQIPFGRYAGDDGPATAAHLNYPSGLAFDADGNLYVADTASSRVRMVDQQGTITTFAGRPFTLEELADYQTKPWSKQPGDWLGDGGRARDARLERPLDLAFAGGRLLVSDIKNHRIRVIEGGVIQTLAGNGSPIGGDQVEDLSFLLMPTPPLRVYLKGPSGVWPQEGRIVLADTDHHLLLEVKDGLIGRVAGLGPDPGKEGEGSFSGDEGPATLAELNHPYDLVEDAAGNLYFSDWGNHRIRRMDPQDRITTVAGDGGTAALRYPRGLAFGPDGNLYVADTDNHRIRMLVLAK